MGSNLSNALVQQVFKAQFIRAEHMPAQNPFS